MKYIIQSCCLLLLLSACSNSATTMEPVDTATIESEQFQKMMDLHDLVMPQMGNLMKLSGQLKEAEATLTEDQAALKAKLVSTREHLDKAHEGMMDWMHGIKPLGDLRNEKNHEEILSYITTEQDKIEEVQTLTNSSIEAAEGLLQEISSNNQQ